MKTNIKHNVKSNIKQQEIKDLWQHLINFYKKYLQNLKYNVKRAHILNLILVGIPSILILSVKQEQGGLLNGQNLLSMTKVIYLLIVVLNKFTQPILSASS